MKAREKIYDSVKDMNPAGLGILYELECAIMYISYCMVEGKKI